MGSSNYNKHGNILGSSAVNDGECMAQCDKLFCLCVHFYPCSEPLTILSSLAVYIVSIQFTPNINFLDQLTDHVVSLCSPIISQYCCKACRRAADQCNL